MILGVIKNIFKLSAYGYSSIEVSQKIKNRNTIGSNNLTSELLAKGNKNRILKRYLCYTYYIFSINVYCIYEYILYIPYIYFIHEKE